MHTQSKPGVLERLAFGIYAIGLIIASIWVLARFGKEDWLVWMLVAAGVASGWYVLVRVSKMLPASED